MTDMHHGRGAAHFLASFNFYCSRLLPVVTCSLQVLSFKFYRSCGTGFIRQMALSSRKHVVDVFYDHEGRYQRERAGLYKTSYDPGQLAAAMNAEEKGCGALGDVFALERGALDFPTELNDDMAEVAARNRALAGSVARYHNMPSVYEMIRPFDIAKIEQTRHLQPQPPSVGVRPQVRYNGKLELN